MLAGRKLLLADDSTTIQKIVALTFTDEGMDVVAVSNGAEAIERVAEILPDVVLADVFMPLMNGYQVCAHIKETENLKHIPVMLLVGSFEPFDGAEARRVGADDTLTKPFQSIRTLVDKVGALMGHVTPDPGAEAVSINGLEQEPDTAVAAASPTAPGEPGFEVAVASELPAEPEAPPSIEVVQPSEQPMAAAVLEVLTADTQPLSPEARHRLEQSSTDEVRRVYTEWEAETMHTSLDTEGSEVAAEGFGEALLELSDLGPEDSVSEDESILEIYVEPVAPEAIANPSINGAETGAAAAAGLDDSLVAVAAPFAAGAGMATEDAHRAAPEFVRGAAADADSQPEVESSWGLAADAAPFSPVEQYEPGSDLIPAPSQPSEDSHAELPHVSAPGALITLDQLSPDAIDAIARRAVELLSAKVIEEIAWEVVPQLAELMIKQMLEERESQNK